MVKQKEKKSTFFFLLQIKYVLIFEPIKYLFFLSADIEPVDVMLQEYLLSYSFSFLSAHLSLLGFL